MTIQATCPRTHAFDTRLSETVQYFDHSVVCPVCNSDTRIFNTPVAVADSIAPVQVDTDLFVGKVAKKTAPVVSAPVAAPAIQVTDKDVSAN